MDPILILTGPPGSGKTTVARLLAESAERGVHIESDYFFRFIAGGYVEPWKPESHPQNRTVMRIVGDAAVSYAQAGYQTIVDGIVIPGWFFEPLRNSIRSAGFDIAYAVLRVPLSTAVERTSGRSNQRLADPAVVEQIWNAFADLGELEHHGIETEGLTAEATADLITERVRAGELTA